MRTASSSSCSPRATSTELLSPFRVRDAPLQTDLIGLRDEQVGPTRIENTTAELANARVRFRGDSGKNVEREQAPGGRVVGQEFIKGVLTILGKLAKRGTQFGDHLSDHAGVRFFKSLASSGFITTGWLL